jgi:hypothetical protein
MNNIVADQAFQVLNLGSSEALAPLESDRV